MYVGYLLQFRMLLRSNVDHNSDALACRRLEGSREWLSSEEKEKGEESPWYQCPFRGLIALGRDHRINTFHPSLSECSSF